VTREPVAEALAAACSDREPVAEALAAACSDPGVLARLAGPLGAAARAAAAGPPARATRIRRMAIARAAVPEGLRGIHPSWIEAALAELPPRARTAVASGGGDPVDVWLARWATAAFPPMPPVSATSTSITSPASAAQLDAAALTGWLHDAGADQLALALGAAGPAAVPATARLLGPRLTTAAARIGSPPRAGALGPIRAAIARCRVSLDDRTLLVIGARAVAPHLDALTRRRIVHRLPRPLGQAIAGELEAASRTPLAEAPRWHALIAP
jgi:hypothetical protein